LATSFLVEIFNHFILVSQQRCRCKDCIRLRQVRRARLALADLLMTLLKPRFGWLSYAVNANPDEEIDARSTVSLRFSTPAVTKAKNEK
jgi:hypothetical protein